mmetsp:Transcript_31562/g.90612  ORF Transcript_31562/g.90612 Transcript_31562/m.90612 type:complete len:998 (-) Transcript_31562:313-3306(-)
MAASLPDGRGPGLSMVRWEWQDDATAWKPFPEADQATIEGLYQCSGGKPQEIADLSWNKGFDSLYRYDFSVMKQSNLASGKTRLLRRREVPCCPRGHELQLLRPGAGPAAEVHENRETELAERSGATEEACGNCGKGALGSCGECFYHCRVCSFGRCLRCQGDVLHLKAFHKLDDWCAAFKDLSRQQLDRLHGDVSVQAQLKRDSLGVVWRSWSDTERSFGSEEGKATTDITFFAMPPQGLRGAKFGGQTADFVNFPAVRAPNYFDEVDVVPSADGVVFDVENRYGQLERGVTLRRFVAQIGRFIPDLAPAAAWADPIDETPLQSASQFSIIPAPSGSAEVGVAAFGHQCCNLHVVIAPSGHLGWAPERPGATRLFFRDASGRKLCSIALTPETREEVKEAFFRLETRDETVEEEKRRYEDVKNRLIHLQITMDGITGAPGSAAPSVGRGNLCPGGHKLDVFYTPHEFICDHCNRSLPAGTKMFGCRPCDYDHCVACWQLHAPKNCKERAVPAALQSTGATGVFKGGGKGGNMSGCVQGYVPPAAAAAFAPPSAAVATPAAATLRKGPSSWAELEKNLAERRRLARSECQVTRSKKFRQRAKTMEKKEGRGKSVRERDEGSYQRCMKSRSRSGGAPAVLEVDAAVEEAESDAEEAESEAECEDETMGAGLLLAVVGRGPELWPTSEADKVPANARRKAGVAVRVTYMYYGLAGDGQLSAERVRRFVRQMDFRRRELGLPHGSLVSGLGSWGGPENAPIKLFGFRLTDAADSRKMLPVITGISALPVPSDLLQACRSLQSVVPGIDAAARRAEAAAGQLRPKGAGATEAQVAALYLYTMEHAFYRQLNAAMRHEDRSRAQHFFGYLRLLLSGLQDLAAARAAVQAGRSDGGAAVLWRGVHLDLAAEHAQGDEVVWWGASSCTPKLSVARGFLGCSGRRTLFRVCHQSAVPIKEFSAFRGEEEWLLAPGTKFTVEAVEKRAGGPTVITLSEMAPPRAVG